MYLMAPKIFFLTINAIIYTFSVHKKEYIKSMKNEQEYTILFMLSDIFMQNQIHLCNLGDDYFR